MENSKIVEVTDSLTGEVFEHIIITRQDGSELSMLKSTWDELEAAKENGTIS
jgi:hypothetical protein